MELELSDRCYVCWNLRDVRRDAIATCDVCHQGYCQEHAGRHHHTDERAQRRVASTAISGRRVPGLRAWLANPGDELPVYAAPDFDVACESVARCVPRVTGRWAKSFIEVQLD